MKVEFKDENYPYKRHVYNYTPISEEEEGLVSEKLTSMKSHRQSNLTEAESSAVGPGELVSYNKFRNYPYQGLK